MPEDHYRWLPRESLLSYEEIVELTKAFASLGVTKLRLTGGEPLLRRDLATLVSMVRAVPGIEQVALTTNGVLLASVARQLRDAGLDRVTISLDTLIPERMADFARSTRHPDVIAGIDAVIACGFANTKLNAVVVRGYNDDEVVNLVRFASARGLEIRFIEYMDVGGATEWSESKVVPLPELLDRLEQQLGAASPMSRADDPTAPARRWRFANGEVVGIIASTTAPFCRDCDRGRVTADGTFFRCLYADAGFDLRTNLRDGASVAEMAAWLRELWLDRTDRGAEERVFVPARDILVPLVDLRADPRREMHVRGG